MLASALTGLSGLSGLIGSSNSQGVIIDTFNRADSATGLGVADTGQTWQQLDGVAGISSNQAYSPGGNTGGYQETGYYDGRVQITLPVNGGGARLICRLTDANNYIFLTVSTTSIILRKIVNGSITALNTITINSPTSTFALVFIGSLLVVQVDGVTVATANESFNQFATKAGFRLQGSSDRADNFIFTPFTTLISDGFDRPDAAIGNADTGQVWQFIGNGSITVSGGKAVRATGTGVGIAYIDSGVADGSLITTFSGAADTAQIIRVKDISNYWMVRSSGVGGQYILTKSVNGALSNVVATGVSANGDLVQTVFVGNVYRVYVNGVLTINYTDTNNFLADKTYHGLRGGGTLTNVSWDNLSFASASVVAYDRFNRGDSPTLGKAETGQSWVNGVTAGNSLASGKAVVSGNNFGRTFILTGLNDVALQYKVPGASASNNGQAFLKVVDDSNYYAIGRSNTATSIFKAVGGSITANIVLGASGNGTDDVVKGIADGPTLLLYRNGTFLGGVSDTSITGATKSGVGGNPIGTSADDFLASVLPSPNLYDSFNRADSATTLGVADSGQAWVAENGTWGISSNRAYSVTNLATNVASIDTGVLNYVLNYTFNGQVNDATNRCNPCSVLRFIDTSNYLFILCESNGIYLQKRDAGSATVLATTTVTLTDNVDTSVTAILNGDVINLYVNGVFAFTYTLSGADSTKFGSGSTATKAGIYLRTLGTPPTTARWDNFKVRAL